MKRDIAAALDLEVGLNIFLVGRYADDVGLPVNLAAEVLRDGEGVLFLAEKADAIRQELISAMLGCARGRLDGETGWAQARALRPDLGRAAFALGTSERLLRDVSARTVQAYSMIVAIGFLDEGGSTARDCAEKLHDLGRRAGLPVIAVMRRVEPGTQGAYPRVGRGRMPRWLSGLAATTHTVGQIGHGDGDLTTFPAHRLDRITGELVSSPPAPVTLARRFGHAGMAIMTPGQPAPLAAPPSAAAVQGKLDGTPGAGGGGSLACDGAHRRDREAYEEMLRRHS